MVRFEQDVPSTIATSDVPVEESLAVLNVSRTMQNASNVAGLAGEAHRPDAVAEYWAFITYSHSDARAAHRLHRTLEGFRLPPTVAQATLGYSGRARLRPIFMDRAELAGGADLPAAIEDALRRSRALVVVCSPAAAASRWVETEIRTFMRLGRGDRIFPVVVDGGLSGRVADVFPLALTQRVATDGLLHTVEPLAADLRRGRDGYRDGVLKIIAGILNVSFDTLKRRERQTDRKRKFALAGALAASILAAAFGYLSIADWVGGIPASDNVRLFLDSHDASLFRAVPSENAIRRTAAHTRQALTAAVLHYLQTGEILSFTPDGRIGGTWELGQVATAIVRAPETTSPQIVQVKNWVDRIFAPKAQTRIGGQSYGWLRYQNKINDNKINDEPQAEASLWPVIALTALLARSGSFDSAQRARLRSELFVAQSAATQYYPLARGGWDHFPEQIHPEHAALYPSALALAALLSTQHLNLPWHDRTGRDVRRRLLQSTVAYLIATYDRQPRLRLPGWHDSFANADPIEAGTLLVYAVLLKGCDAGAFTLPTYIFSDIEKRLTAMQPSNEGPFSNQPDLLREDVRTPKGTDSWTYGIQYLWYPAAFQCAVAWLKHEQRVGADHAKLVAARRRVNEFVSIADQVLHEPDGTGFYGAETLMALDEIALPEAP